MSRLRPPVASTPPGYASDPKYKKYTQQVEKCLSSFDNVGEWADFISFLKQLLKVRLRCYSASPVRLTTECTRRSNRTSSSKRSHGNWW